MKVKALILCLALVPAVLAQAAPEATQEPEESWYLGGIVSGIMDNVVDFFKSNVDTESIRQNAVARMEQGRKLMVQGWATFDEAMQELSVDVPEVEIPSIEEIIANLTAKYEEFSAETQEKFQLFQTKINDEFSLFNDESEEQEPENEPESEPESEPEAKGIWSYFF